MLCDFRLDELLRDKVREWGVVKEVLGLCFCIGNMESRGGCKCNFVFDVSLN